MDPCVGSPGIPPDGLFACRSFDLAGELLKRYEERRPPLPRPLFSPSSTDSGWVRGGGERGRRVGERGGRVEGERGGRVPRDAHGNPLVPGYYSEHDLGVHARNMIMLGKVTWRENRWRCPRSARCPPLPRPPFEPPVGHPTSVILHGVASSFSETKREE